MAAATLQSSQQRGRAITAARSDLDFACAFGHSARVRDQWREQCPNLFQVLAGYLHQDFNLDYDSAEAALADAVASQGHEQVKRASIELATFRPPSDDESGSRLFANWLCYYHPPADGLTYSAWLDHVQEVLEQAAAR